MAAAEIDVIGVSECIALLSATTVGRLCLLDDGVPAAFPVNYRLVPDHAGQAAILIRVSAGTVLHRPDAPAGFQVDDIDNVDGSGWSVLAVGVLRDADSSLGDPHPWVDGRDHTMALTIERVSGRRLHRDQIWWTATLRGYL
jgi:hypothetical protein